MKNTRIVSLSLVGLLLLSGCGSSEKTVDKSNNTIITSVQIETKVFESGTHIVKYVEKKFRASDTIHRTSGYDVGCPIVPEGYTLIDVEPYASDYEGATDGYTYFFINEVDVEVEGEFNSETKTMEYPNPGKPVENKLSLS